MRQRAYINGKVFLEREFHEGLVVIVDGSTISHVIGVTEFTNDGHEIVDLDGDYLIPGFIDIQVNGGGGVLFNDSPNVEGVKAIAEAHRQFGTTGLLPTLISDDLDVIRKGLAAVESAIEIGVPGVLGIHIEGPFLNLKRRGIHDASKIRKLTDEIVSDLQPLKNGCSLLTIAPETMSPDLIRRLKDKGFILCAGHSNATYAEVSTAIDQGISGFTHLFNAMSQLGAREPGMVGAALDHDNTWCGIIVDGHHVSHASIRIAYRCKSVEKLMLVTDAMPPVGSSSDEFELMGNRITVKDGVCVDAAGTLAGAALDMASAVRNMMLASDCSLAEASQMASSSPAAFLGLEQSTGTIRAGMRADFVVLDAQFNAIKTIIAGE
jgi:N-acetylglucosamine-6-phosphate deacetylase